MTLEINPERQIEILYILVLWAEKNTASKLEVRSLYSLIAKLVFIAACVRSGRIFLSRMFNFWREMPDNQDGYILLYEF